MKVVSVFMLPTAKLNGRQRQIIDEALLRAKNKQLWESEIFRLVIRDVDRSERGSEKKGT
jgi:hypothetical protein